jgi:hypothetical protein
VFGHGETALRVIRPTPDKDHSIKRFCNESPV